MRRTLTLAAIVATATLSWIESGEAAPEGFCRGYAQEAVSQAREAQRRGCASGSARYSTDYGVHFNWCRQVS
jgi:hypothetical protein